MIAEKPLETNAYIERGDGNGLGIVKTKAVMNQNWQVASTQVSFIHTWFNWIGFWRRFQYKGFQRINLTFL